MTVPTTGTGPQADRIRRTALRFFGHPSLLPGQAETMGALLDGRDVLLVSPTGSGKSLGYQVAGVLLEGCTIVVSPLLALQHDQIAGLGVDHPELRAARLSSAESPAQRREVLEQAKAGLLEFVFLSPEQLANPEVSAQVAELQPSLVAVDEAHCVSSWGHDFRPDYFRLGELIEAIGSPPVIAMTATAALPVRDDIVERLRLRDPALVVTGFARENLALRVVRATTGEDQHRAVLDLVEDSEGAGIVYCRTRRSAERYAEELTSRGRPTAVYHAGLPQARRAQVHEAFLAGDAPLIAATSAFGMGIDKPDIRFVVHAEIPESPDTYYQEVGRAGRDGEPATATLVYRPEDLSLGRFFAGGVPERDDVRTVLRAAARSSVDPAQQRRDVAKRTGLGPRKVARILNLSELVAEAGGPTGAGSRAADAVVERAEAQRRLQQSRVEMMRGYAETDRCRSDYLLGYFGEPVTVLCGTCDNCVAGIAEEPATNPRGPFPLQSQVRHHEFGAGVVTDLEDDRITVIFEDVGYKTLSLELVEQQGLLELVS
ncbi:MAG: ATP-dependent helicase RecQ [Nocardioidaceae bacterium]|jgi:ATP-dependent DNA helicase RecQ|nr:ATP-dependent helicase RecQ [Nocardioidaceae bacterium]